MCGICGILRSGALKDASVVDRMTDAMAYRGPDDRGVWADADAGIALGHRRLSILDLSPLGHQPMISQCGRFVISYNGEVYNYRALQGELGEAGCQFQGGSDTEVLLAAIARWGVEKAVEKCVGMFAFALWDRRDRELILVRDRLGIKPLYYGKVGEVFLFASELKSIKGFPGFDNPIDRGALSLFFRHNYIPAPHSIYQGIAKLEPGTILRVRPGKDPQVTAYWSAGEAWQRGIAAPFEGTEGEAVDQLEALLKDAVGSRMISDVPLGAFLSGGIDSSTVVSLMQAQSSRPVRTFSIGFNEADYDEAGYARRVAEHLGTEHTELYLDVDDMAAIVPSLPDIWDEPFADSSQIPTYYVSELARRHVAVSLSGDGGDELFAGYDRYFWSQKVSRLLALPLPVRKAMAAVGEGLPAGLYGMLGSLGQKARWRLGILRSRDFKSLYRFLISHNKSPADFVLSGFEPESALTGDVDVPGDLFQRMTLWDSVSYLPDDILTKVDRASMTVSLEARVPILDHRVVEFAATLPTGMKVAAGQGKHILRQVLQRYVPQHLTERPKMGFGIPVARWLREDLRDWCESLLEESLLRRQGYIDPAAVRHMWDKYLAGETYYCHFLWDILMFQAWLARWE